MCQESGLLRRPRGKQKMYPISATGGRPCRSSSTLRGETDSQIADSAALPRRHARDEIDHLPSHFVSGQPDALPVTRENPLESVVRQSTH